MEEEKGLKRHIRKNPMLTPRGRLEERAIACSKKEKKLKQSLQNGEKASHAR